MGNTDPVTKLQKFLVGVTNFAKVAVRPPPGVNLEEVWKEIMALSGYSDGERFTLGQDPEKARLAQMIQQLQMKIQQLMLDRKNKTEAAQAKIHTNRENNIVKLMLADKEDRHENVKLYAGHLANKDMAEQQAQIAAQAQAMQPQQPQPVAK